MCSHAPSSSQNQKRKERSEIISECIKEKKNLKLEKDLSWAHVKLCLYASFF